MEIVPWSEAETNWQQREEDIWREFYEKKGYKTWKDWRWSTIKTLHLPERQWQRVQLQDPKVEVGQMYCNALTRWREFYHDRALSTFNDLKDHPFFQNHGRIKSMKTNFPSPTEMIGLTYDDKTIIIDGHHRAISLAQMTPEEVAARNPTVRLVYSEFNESEKEDFERIFQGDYFFQGDRFLILERKILDAVGVVRSRIKAAFAR